MMLPVVALLSVLLQHAGFVDGKNRLLKKEHDGLKISSKLDILLEYPEYAASWRVYGIQMVYCNAGYPHSAIKIDMDWDVNRPYNVPEKLAKAVDENGKKKPEIVMNLLWHLMGLTKNDEILSSMQEQYAGRVLGSVGTIDKGLTLGRLLECVNAKRIDTKLTSAKCFTFAMRVIRFVTGDCECGDCAGPKRETPLTMAPLSPKAQASFWVSESMEGFLDILDYMDEYIEKKAARTGLLVDFKRFFGLTLNTSKATKTVAAMRKQMLALRDQGSTEAKAELECSECADKGATYE